MSTYVSFSVENSDTESDTVTITPNDESSLTLYHETDHNFHKNAVPGGLFKDYDDSSDCKDGSHHDFARILLDKLFLLYEGLIDPRPSVFKEEVDFSEFFTNTAGNSSEDDDNDFEDVDKTDIYYEMGKWTPMKFNKQNYDYDNKKANTNTNLASFGSKLTANLNIDLKSLAKSIPTPAVSNASRGLSKVPTWMQKLNEENDFDDDLEEELSTNFYAYDESCTEVDFSAPAIFDFDLEEDDSMLEDIRHRIYCDLE